jgi:hypothetical protein
MTVLAGGGLQKHKANPRWKRVRYGYVKTEYGKGDGAIEPWCPQTSNGS